MNLDIQIFKVYFFIRFLSSFVSFCSSSSLEVHTCSWIYTNPWQSKPRKELKNYKPYTSFTILLTFFVLQCQADIVSILFHSKQTIIKSVVSCALYTVYLYVPLDIYFVRFFNHRNLRNRKLEQKLLLAYVNGINIIAYKNICGERKWAWGEASDEEIETDFFQGHKWLVTLKILP